MSRTRLDVSNCLLNTLTSVASESLNLQGACLSSLGALINFSSLIQDALLVRRNKLHASSKLIAFTLLTSNGTWVSSVPKNRTSRSSDKVAKSATLTTN